MAATGPRLGTVSAFDVDRGLGSVTADDGGELAFHCTAIADGTRTIEVGARVTFVVVPGHLGRDEARSVTGLSPSRPAVADPSGGPGTD